MMGAVARAARAGGAHTVGVIPAHLVPYEVADTDADELVVVDTMRERKRIMDERSDAFLALPGGIGTLEELFEMWTARLAGHARQAGDRARSGRLLRRRCGATSRTLRDQGFVRQAALDVLHRVGDGGRGVRGAGAQPPIARRRHRQAGRRARWKSHQLLVLVTRPALARSPRSRNICLSTRTPSADCPATLPASSRAARLRLLGGRGAVQQPESSRPRPSPTTRPVNTRSFARDTPISGASRPGRPARPAARRPRPA